MIAYYAKIYYDRSDKAYLVEFPDLPGCVTYGNTFKEAEKFAVEALSVYLESIDQRSEKIPRATKRNGKNYFLIKPEKAIAFAIWLKSQRELRGLTQRDVADKLGISYQTYQRFEDPSRANPTLKTIQKLENVFQQELISV